MARRHRTQRESEGDPGGGAEKGQGGIPKERVDAMMAKATEEADRRAARAEERAELERERRVEAEERNANRSTAAPEKVWTREELTALVEDGKITQERMDQQLAIQEERRIDELVNKRVDERVSAASATQTLEAKLAEYTAAVPKLGERGSEEHQRFSAEYKAMVELGMPDDLRTQVAACRALYGEPAKRVERESAEAPESPAAVRSRASDDHEAGDPDGPPKGLSDRHRRQYQKMIDKGMYTGWDDERLVEEMGHIEGVEVAAA